ncbi:MAG: hypothetical protein JSW51_01750 [Gemmatimonadota bacterium]|nr:MAG: hypothetical protein JSW51_01750 [Gemmatimonadota bacterium]
MTGCTDSSLPVICRELDETIDSLVPVVEDLLQRLSDVAPVACETEGSGARLTVPLRFPDGIGQGQVVAALFRWREAARLDIEIVHNRTFTRPDGGASDRKCFMNDFAASIKLPVGTNELPQEFERHVISGVLAARDAVQRHNRKSPAPWSQVKVSAV